MNLKTLRKSLVNLEILCYIHRKKACSSAELLNVFKGRIIRRTLYHLLKNWDLGDSIIFRDNIDHEKALYSHFTIKATPKLSDFIQTQLFSSLSSILDVNFEVKDTNLQLMKDLEDFHKDITIPQILELLKEKGVSELYSELLKILTKSVEILFLKKVVSDSVKRFQVPEKI